ADVGGHVGDYKVDFPALERLLEPTKHGFLAEIALDDRNARDRRYLEQVERDHLPRAADALRQHLRPASRRRTEIDHRLPDQREAFAPHDLERPEPRPRAAALRAAPPRLRVVRVPP